PDWSHLFPFADAIEPNYRRGHQEDIAMPSPDIDINLLVRAFNASWDFYFQPSRITSVRETLARPALAAYLISKVREGITDEPSLAAAGLQFLFELEDELEEPIDDPVDETNVSWELHLENATARFEPFLRVQIRRPRLAGSLVW